MSNELSENLESNSVARERLKDIFGEICFIEKLDCKSKYGKKAVKYTAEKQREKMEKLKEDRQLTYHHIIEDRAKGLTSVANGALLYGGNHIWFNTFCTVSEQISMDKEFQEYKIKKLEKDKYYNKILELEDFKVPTYIYYSSQDLNTEEKKEKRELIEKFDIEGNGKVIKINGKKDLFWIFDGNEWKLHLEEKTNDAKTQLIETDGKIEVIKTQPKGLSKEERKEEEEKRLEKRRKELESNVKEKGSRKINIKKIRKIEDDLLKQGDIREMPPEYLDLLVKGESSNYKEFEEINNDNENEENDKIVEGEAITTNFETKENNHKGNKAINKFIRNKKINRVKKDKKTKSSLVIKTVINKILNKIDNINENIKVGKVLKQRNEVLHNTSNIKNAQKQDVLKAQNTLEEKRENFMDRLKIPQEDLKQLKDSQQLNKLEQSKELKQQAEQEINNKKTYRQKDVKLAAIPQNDPEMVEDYVEWVDEREKPDDDSYEK